MKINSEAEMMNYGRDFAKTLQLPAVIDLTGDVGTGKTTFTRGLAEGLGIREAITSPSFTISKRYAFTPGNVVKNTTPITEAELVHYDFYRLADPGIMREELAETIAQPNTVVVVEWGEEVDDILPATRHSLQIKLNPDGSRTITEEKR